MTETDIANLALGKIGGAGDQASGSAFISDIDDDTDKVAVWCKHLMAPCRRRVIIDLAAAGCPPRETIKFADLGSAVGADNLPEIGEWEYAFNLPSDCLSIVQQFDEGLIAQRNSAAGYKFETALNKDGNGLLLLTDNYSNSAGDSAFVEYAIDQTNTDVFSMTLIDCIATLLAAELCPLIGKDMKLRQQILAEYDAFTIPNAKVHNQSQFNNYAKSTPNYLGGRGS